MLKLDVEKMYFTKRSYILHSAPGTGSVLSWLNESSQPRMFIVNTEPQLQRVCHHNFIFIFFNTFVPFCAHILPHAVNRVFFCECIRLNELCFWLIMSFRLMKLERREVEAEART